MKNFILGVLAAMILSNGAAAVEKVLPQPQTEGGMPLMQAIKQRRAVRDFSNKPIDEQTLSNLLWATYGVSNEEGKRTIPTAKNLKELEVYVAKDDGVWLYDADNNKLEQVSDQNILDLFNTQDYMQNAPLNLIFTGDRDGKFVDMHAGSAYQNAGLYATSVGLNNVVRAWFDHEAVEKALKLPETKKVIVSQAFGWGN